MYCFATEEAGHHVVICWRMLRRSEVLRHIRIACAIGELGEWLSLLLPYGTDGQIINTNLVVIDDESNKYVLVLLP